ncbi:tetratricopeptide repeat protein [Fulvivirga sediminis]|uniref:histidine kinase n=1 Tax=Fulvivirga sediminis TaxID=2803949 RepID=A0A937F6G3_9BACT|nr:tetratricopeptide repeat protein [Fulvivirga sediminis]MBL3657261.1 tetratricopeptide repeat protein [Fulvivirga sediminis]
MRGLLFVFLFFCTIKIYGQSEIDSIQELLSQDTLSPSHHIELLNNISEHYLGNDNNKFTFYNQQSIALATDEGDLLGLVNAKLLLTKYYQKSGDIERAMQICDELLQKSTDKQFTLGVILSHNKKGDLFNKVGSYDQALSVLNKALALAEEIRDSTIMASIFNNKGVSFYHSSRIDSAIFYYELGLNQRRQNADSLGMAAGMINIGGVYYTQGNYQLARSYFSTAAAISKRINNKSYHAAALNNLGLADWRLGDYDDAIEAFHLSYELSAEMNNKRTMAFCLANLGIIAHEKADYPESLEYYLRAVAIRSELNDSTGLGTSYYNLGLLFKDWRDDSTAYNYYQKSLVIREAIGDVDGQASVYNSIGELYSEAKEYDKAKAAYQNALSKNLNIGNKGKMISTFINMSKLYLTTGNLDSAKVIIDEAMLLAREIKSLYMKAELEGKLGSYYYKKGLYRESKKHLLKSLQYANENNLKDLENNGRLLLSQVYSALGDHKSAYKELITHLALKDSISNQDVIRKTSRIEAKYAFQKEKDSLAFVRQREQLAYETELSQEKIKKQWMILVLILSVLVLGLMAYLLYNRQKKNKLLYRQKEVLDEALAVNSKYFSIISHDLRGFLLEYISISGLLLHFARHGKIEKIEDLGINMKRSSQNTLHLLDNLLHWSIDKEFSLSKYKTVINVNNLIIELIELFKGTADSKNILLHFETQPDLFIKGTENGVKTIFRNIIYNAIKFTKQGNNIFINSYTADNKIVIEVRDEGIGMSEDQLKKINEFDAAPLRGTQNERGVGLGMRLIREFANRNNGELLIQSQVGVGTTIKVTFIQEMPEGTPKSI